jgi:histidine triad (HIT) family protein
MKASGARDYNILQNNGAPAHQAVFHVHFHIIPKPDDSSGLGVGWRPGQLENAEQLAEEIRAALSTSD